MALFDVCESSFFCPFDATFKIFLPLVLKQNCQYALLVFISGSYKMCVNHHFSVHLMQHLKFFCPWC
jgi:hypothetical protein